jgi:CheY-like chemotaxis protein
MTVIHCHQMGSQMELSLDYIIERYSESTAQSPIDLEMVTTAVFLKDLKDYFQIKCIENDLIFHMDVLTPLPEFVLTDPRRINQIFHNLISNSIRHTIKGGILLKVSYSDLSQLLYFDVIDSGEGIPEKFQPSIFDVFQINSPHKKFGCGLGLPLSRDTARALKGDLKLLRSFPGEGAWFRLEVKNQAAEKAVSPPYLESWKIMLVDDLVDNLRSLEVILKPTKAIIDSTTSPAEAVQNLREKPYDLFLVDLQMPEMDGFETLAAARQAGFKGEIWAVSAYATKSDMVRCHEAGFAEHISKPTLRSDLYDKLIRLRESADANNKAN